MKGNELTYRLGHGFEVTPKTVWASLALSLALRLAGDGSWSTAFALLESEWRALHANKLVPQYPRRLAPPREV